MAVDESFVANSFEDKDYNNTVTAEDVLGSLFAPEDTVNFRVFDDRKGGVFTGQKLSCKCAEYKSIEPELKLHNAQNRGVFFVVNSGGQTDDSITRINAQFVEMDSGTFEEQWEKVDAFKLPPSMVIQTRKSLHVYWFMDNSTKVSRFREIQKRLVKHFNGDPACVNESRVMRLPGFNHCKTDTLVMVRCVLFRPERVYSQEQLANVLVEPEGETAPVLAEHESGAASGTENGLEIVENSCDFIKYCKDNAANLQEPLWHAMISNLLPFEGGVEKIHELSAPYHGYSERETSRKISNVLKSGTGPMTCETIRDRGFKCLKVAQGGCGVKSPAALCYKPLGADALVDILRKQPVTGDLLKDVETAKKYVTDYLCNQDRVIADIIINNKLSEHFRLKQNIVKSLYNEYKSANKAYSANELTKASQNNRSLPDWYEATNNNGLRFLPGVLASHMADTLPVFYAAGRYYRYSSGVYVTMDESEAQRLVQEKMLTREAKMRQITDAEGQWRLMARRDIKDLNSNPYVINLRNGLYNVKDDRLTEHTPDYLSIVQLPVNYDAKADCPLFRRFLDDAMCGDMGQVRLIQEMLGYCLIPVTSAQKCFILTGEAKSGKSTLISVISEVLLGKENVSNVSWQALNEKFKPAELFGKLANTFSDLSMKTIYDNGMFKSLVGEDYITVEKKHKDPFSFKSTARLIFSCNSIPKNDGDKSEGFYRRLIIVKFNRSVPEQDCDPNLLDKLRGEADGIFMFALEGLKRLMHNNYRFSETQANMDELQRYREDSDSVLSFVRDNCEQGPAYVSGSTELFKAYKTYCTVNNIIKGCEQAKFVQHLTSSYPNITRGRDKVGGSRTLRGIRVI